MKDFFKTMAACLAALLLAGGGMMFFVLVLFGAMAAAGDPSPTIEKDSMLVFDLSANIADAPGGDSGEEMLSRALGADEPQRMQLRQVIAAIEAAAVDERIKGIYLHGSLEPMNYGSGYGALLEVRAALTKFREAGKPIVAYLEAPTHRDLLLASTGTRVLVNPLGVVIAPGLGAEVVYYGAAFKRFGVGVQIARAGSYKSAGERYVEEHMSAPEREQLTALLGDIWSEFVARVAESRGIAEDALRQAVDERSLLSAEEAVEAGLADAAVDFAGVLAELRELTGAKPEARTFRQVALPAYIRSRERAPGAVPAGDKIAVVYAEGVIVDGEGSPDTVGGDRLARELRRIRRDDKIKAVVLRVNSPGGSALASEAIRSELALLHEEKPIVVSMGTVAASGGYWISTAADRVFAQPNTITGSIGVIMMVPNFEQLAGLLSLNVEQVKLSRHADILSVMKARDPEAMGILQNRVSEVYEAFLDRVSESRKMDRAVVEPLAGGRVWSGADALQNGLVDEIGGLDRAIADAANRAGLEQYAVIDVPAARNFMQEFLERLSGREPPLSSRVPAIGARSQLVEALQLLETFNDPGAVYARLPFNLELN